MDRDSSNKTKIADIVYDVKDARRYVVMCMNRRLSSLVTPVSLLHQCYLSLARLPHSCHGSMLQDNRSRLCHRAFNPAMQQSSDATSRQPLPHTQDSACPSTNTVVILNYTHKSCNRRLEIQDTTIQLVALIWAIQLFKCQV